MPLFILAFLIIVFCFVRELFMFFVWPKIKARIDAYNKMIEAERIVKEQDAKNLLAKAKALEVQDVEVEDCGKVSWHVHNGKQRGEHIVYTELIIINKNL